MADQTRREVEKLPEGGANARTARLRREGKNRTSAPILPRKANREAIVACVEEGIEEGALRPDTDVPGLAALFEGLLVGLSIQARDGLPGKIIDAAITQALKAWDENGAVTQIA